ncbi:MAG: chemotaxis protein CheC [Deltaproteobacteria bacterium]|nr:chemotaxis protein CheC [Deltaproteobacteria bacterium]
MSDLATGLETNPGAADALLEVLNIGSGNALSSLARLLGTEPITMAVPELLTAASLPTASALQTDGIVVHLEVAGAARCRFLLALDTESAAALVSTLLPAGAATTFDDAEAQSAILETANIISCSFLGAVASLMRGVLIPSPPAARVGALDAIVRGHMGEDAIALCSRFVTPRKAIAGCMLLVTNVADTTPMLSALQTRRTEGP